MNRLGAALFAVTVAGQAPGFAAPSEEQATLYPIQKPPYSDVFRVPEPKTAVKPREFRFEGTEIQVEVRTSTPRTFTPRIVCGMKMIEAPGDVDPRIVIPIPERHGAKIRVLGPPPCADAPPVAPDRR